ncbi:MAG: methyltransferase domain-containing protein [Elusimicrobiales bacterium]|nr:methyltransferase domain-containing protein [Elusimicrobiales bacterium]
MGFEVLKESSENRIAREELRRRNLDFTSSGLTRALRKLRLIDGITIGDVRKSWDVLKTVDFIGKNVKFDAKILDFGSYASEILPILHQCGYTNLKGVDLNPNLKNMPYSNKIDYCVGNFMSGSLSGKFDVITAISVIEHGYKESALVKVLSDLVAPGGYFIASVDYWPTKIDTI